MPFYELCERDWSDERNVFQSVKSGCLSNIYTLIGRQSICLTCDAVVSRTMTPHHLVLPLPHPSGLDQAPIPRPHPSPKPAQHRPQIATAGSCLP